MMHWCSNQKSTCARTSTKLKEVKEPLDTEVCTWKGKRSALVWRGETTTGKQRSDTETREVEGREQVDGDAGEADDDE